MNHTIDGEIIEDDEIDNSEALDRATAAPIGHNSGNTGGGVAAQKLKNIIERYERLQEEKDGIGEDQKELLIEAKSLGFEVPVIRLIIKIRKADKDKLRALEEMKALYMDAIGMEPI